MNDGLDDVKLHNPNYSVVQYSRLRWFLLEYCIGSPYWSMYRVSQKYPDSQNYTSYE